MGAIDAVARVDKGARPWRGRRCLRSAAEGLESEYKGSKEARAALAIADF